MILSLEMVQGWAPGLIVYTYLGDLRVKDLTPITGSMIYERMIPPFVIFPVPHLLDGSVLCPSRWFAPPSPGGDGGPWGHFPKNQKKSDLKKIDGVGTTYVISYINIQFSFVYC